MYIKHIQPYILEHLNALFFFFLKVISPSEAGKSARSHIPAPCWFSAPAAQM